MKKWYKSDYYFCRREASRSPKTQETPSDNTTEQKHGNDSKDNGEFRYSIIEAMRYTLWFKFVDQVNISIEIGSHVHDLVIRNGIQLIMSTMQ